MYGKSPKHFASVYIEQFNKPLPQMLQKRTGINLQE